MIDSRVPKPTLCRRPPNPELAARIAGLGFDPWVSSFVATRLLKDESIDSQDIDLTSFLFPRLKDLSSPFNMHDMDKAALRVSQAILNGEYIGIETDHDCDGQTSHAVFYDVFTRHFHYPVEKLRSYIGHRLKEGYGLSEALTSRILADSPRPSLIITADNGSSDEPRIARLKSEGIEVIVTDHHQIPQAGCPISAYACLNPTQASCDYGDPYIAGCMVAWLLMAAVRQKLIEQGYLPKTAPNLADVLDFVAVGTIADCVSMAKSVNNRAVVKYGLQLINQTKRPCWRAIKAIFSEQIRSEDIGFRIAPLLNSDGRLASAMSSVSFLLCDTDIEARNWVKALQLQNDERKLLQRKIFESCLKTVKDQIDKHCFAIILYMKEGHPGVQGIVASRLAEMFGRPAAIFAPKYGQENLITGSIRGRSGFHVREALQQAVNEMSEAVLAFGGHRGAGGITLNVSAFERFADHFEAAAHSQLKTASQLGPVIWTDGELKREHLTLNFLDTILNVEPFGREFELPIFELQAEVSTHRAIGDGRHLKLGLMMEGLEFQATWFNARSNESVAMPVKIGDKITVACQLKENIFKGFRKLDIHVLEVFERI